MIKNDMEMKQYLPDEYYKKLTPDRTFFFNTVNTFYPGFLQALITGAQKQRVDVQSTEEAKQTIEATDEWVSNLSAIPFFSKVSIIISLFNTIMQKNGRTLHLLKQGSKAQPASRKRKKYSVVGTLQEYKKQKLDDI